MTSAKIKKALKDSNLSSAIQLLSSRINDLGNYDLKSMFDEAEATYRAMLTYMLQGYVDSEYSNRRAELTRTLFSLNDKSDRMERIMANDKQSRYVTAFKTTQTSLLQNVQQSLEVDLTPEEHEEELCRLFDLTWSSDLWTKVDYENASNILSSESIVVDDKAIFISAITLALMEMFDEKKLQYLFDAYLYPDGIVNQRAIVGIVIIIKLYDSRLECFPGILSRLKIYADDSHFVNEMFDTLRMLQFSCITESISSKMQNDIFPALMKGQDMMKNMSTDEIREKLTENGENPDWIDKKVHKSIREMSEMQLEGADIYMSSFRYMKYSTFFNKIPHWFYPFNIHSPLLASLRDMMNSDTGKIVSIILNNDVFCDSDKYSFCFMVNALRDQDKKNIKDQMSMQFTDEEMESISQFDQQTKKRSNKTIRRSYIFSIYRFFTCYPFCCQFDNPFKMKRKNADGTERILTYSPLETKAFSFLYTEREEMLTLAEFFMHKGFYEEALDMYALTEPQDIEDDASIWQKVGFCRQKLGKDKSAYKAYMLADELLPDSKWTMTRIAQLAQKLEIYDTAVNYYDMLLLQDNENLKFVVNKAICQMKGGLYSDALATLYQANYLDEESVQIRCMMIECYLKTNQAAKASSMIADIISSEECPIEIRIVNAFLAMKEKSIESAYYYIREAISIFNVSENSGHSFAYYYNKVLCEYSDMIGIEKDLSRMLLDSVNLDIR